MTKKVAFLGLGVMGYPMAGYLAKAGYDVMVYNRTTEKAKTGHKNIPEITPLPQLKPLKVQTWCLPV